MLETIMLIITAYPVVVALEATIVTLVLSLLVQRRGRKPGEAGLSVKRGETSWQAFTFAFIIGSSLAYAVVNGSNLASRPKGLLHVVNFCGIFYCTFLDPRARNSLVKAKNWLQTEVERS